MFDNESALEPGELASISTFDLDDSFWWVWISSLSGEEPAARKAAFGRCALIETVISGARWLVLEEQVKGAAPEPDVGAYIAEKKGFFGFRGRRGRLTRRKSAVKKITPVEEPYKAANSIAPMSKTSIGPDQHARIQAAAAALQRKHKEQEDQQQANDRRARVDDAAATKTVSVLTMQPLILSEASPALKWARNYDKHAVRAAYLGNSLAGTGVPADSLDLPTNSVPRSRSPSPSREPEIPVVPQNDRSSIPVPVAHPVPLPQQEFKPVKSVTPEPTPASLANAAAAELTETAPAEPKSPERNQPAGKKSGESTEDYARKLRKKPATTGLKGMFGKKKNEAPTKSMTAEGSSTAAAAIAPLEGRTAQAALPPSSLPVPKAPASHRLSSFGRRRPQEATTIPAVSKTGTLPAAEAPKPAREAPIQPAPATTEYDGPPRTRRDAEYDALSRVDSNERAQADREFASFDHQSPFADQPAIVPVDTPTTDDFPERGTPVTPVEPQTLKQMEHPMNGHQMKGSPSPIGMEVPTPEQRSWAQIRKDVERNVLKNNNRNNDNNHNNDMQTPQRMSQAEKTDDGETSGEESK
jgi:hypothetical protein